MNFINWYFQVGIPQVFDVSRNFLLFFKHYFSITRLTTSLFAPWKRLGPGKSRGFSFGKWFDEVSFDLISRMIGFVVRLITILTGLVVLVAALVILTVVDAMVILVPVFLYPSYQSYIQRRFRYASGRNVMRMTESLLASKFYAFFLERTKINKQELEKAIGSVELTSGELLTLAYRQAKEWKRDTITDSDVFRVICETNRSMQAVLHTSKLTLNDVGNVRWWYENEQLKNRKIQEFWKKEYLLSIPAIGKEWSAGYTPELDKYSRDLAAEDLRWLPFVGRDEEISWLTRELSRDRQPHVLMYGEPGMGRHSLVQGLAKKIQWHEIPRFRHYRVVVLAAEKYVAETNTRTAAEKIVELIDEAEKATNVILVIDNFEALVTDERSVGVITALEKRLSESRLPLIAITNKSAYFNTIQANASLAKLVTAYELRPMGATEAMKVVCDRIAQVERRQVVKFEYQALKTTIELCDRHVAGAFPEKAMDVVSELVASSEGKQNYWIGEELVRKLLSQKLGIPLATLAENEGKQLLELEIIFKKEIVEQDLAITKLAKALRRARSGVGIGSKPLGSFLFLGPTGVGKTETAKVLSRVYFQNDDLIRIDMAEYQNEEGMERLIGSTRSGSPGILAEKLLSRPFGVLLLDEFEKVPTEVHNLFLTILDEGYFTSAQNQKINCSNLMIIATSNAGSEELREYMDQHGDSGLEEYVVNYLLQERLYSPELLNRFDAVVFFKPLSSDGLREVTKMMLERLKKRMLDTQEVKLEYHDSLIEQIISQGYDRKFGARSIQHYLQDTVEDVIAKALITDPNARVIRL